MNGTSPVDDIGRLARACASDCPGAAIDLSGTFADAFDALVEDLGPVGAVSQLADRCWDDDALLCEAVAGSKRLERPSRTATSIAVFYHTLGTGGAERVTIDTARLWRSMGYEVTLLCDEGQTQGLSFEDEGMSLIELPDCLQVTRESYGTRAEALYTALTDAKADVLVYGQWVGPTSAWDRLVARLAGASFVVFTHGTTRVLTGYDNPTYLRLPLLYRNFDGIVCLGAEDKGFWQTFNRRTYRVLNPVDPSFMDPQQAQLAGHRMLWVGRISHDKTPLEAIDVLGKVVQRVPDATLALAGPIGDCSVEELRRRAEAYGVWEAVELLGDVPHDELPACMRRADVLLFTSHLEGYSLVLAEAKAVGLPPACYALTNLTPLEGGRGVRTAPVGDVDALADLVAELLLDKGKAHELARDARAHMEELWAFDLRAVWEDVFSAVGASSAPDAAGLEAASVFLDAGKKMAAWQRRSCEAEEGRRFLEESLRGTSEALSGIERSVSFKVGRAITAPLRGVRNRLKGDSNA